MTSTDDTTINTAEVLDNLMWDLYFASRVGMGAAEYNLEKASLIEMDQGHVAGIFVEGLSNGWCDCRWTITDRGRRTTFAELERIILLDPPLEIAVMDAALEATIVADTDNDGHRRNFVALNERVESIRRELARRAEAT
jgi:hypothetical protein